MGDSQPEQLVPETEELQQLSSDGSSVDAKEQDEGIMRGYHIGTLNMSMNELERLLNPSDVMDELIAKEIMSHHDVKALELKNSQEGKVRLLISILQRRGSAAFGTFVNALVTHAYQKELVDTIKVNEQHCKEHYEDDVAGMMTHSDRSETFHRLEMLWKVAHSLIANDIVTLKGNKWKEQEMRDSEHQGMTFIKTCWRRKIESMKNVSETMEKLSSINLNRTARKIITDGEKEMTCPEIRLTMDNLPQDWVSVITKNISSRVSFFGRNQILNAFFREEYNVYLIDTFAADNITIVLRIPSTAALGRLYKDVTSCALVSTLKSILASKDLSDSSHVTLNWTEDSLLTIFGPKPLCIPDNTSCDGPSLCDDSFNLSGNMKLHQPGLELLHAIGDDPVAVISVSGPARTGKSYLLSQLMDGIQFTVGHTVDPQTKGIWIASSAKKILQNGVETRIVLLDAEGAGTTETDDQGVWDTKIFAICFLISSLVIYNSRNVPSKADLETLQFVAKFSESVSGQTKGTYSVEDLRKCAPSFLWVFRDVSLKLEEKKYKSWTEYLESKILNETKNHSLNSIKKAIQSSFSSIGAVALKTPSSSPEICQDLHNRAYEKDLAEFRNEIESLKKHIFESLEMRKLGGSKLTGDILADLLKKYIQEINSSGESLREESMWEMHMRVTLQYHLLTFQTNLKESFNKIELPCSSAMLEEKLLAIQQTAKDNFEHEFKLTDEDQQNQITSQVKEIISTELSYIYERNSVESKRQCRICADNLIEEFFGPSELKRKTFEGIKNDILRQFDAKTEGYPCRKEERDDCINRLEYRNEGFVLVDLVKELGEQFEKVITQSLQNEDSEHDINMKYDKQLTSAEAKLKHKSKNRSQNEQQGLLENLRYIFKNSYERASTEWCKDVMEGITRELKRQLNHPTVSDSVRTVDDLLKDYRDKARGPSVKDVEDNFREDLENLREKANDSHNKHVSKMGCISVMEGLMSNLRDQIENPKNVDPSIKLDDLLKQYRRKAQGSEVLVVEEQNKEMLSKLLEEVKTAYESHVACSNVMNNIIKELNDKIDKPKCNDIISTFQQYRTQYRSKASGSQLESIEKQYEDRLKQLCDEAFSVHQSHLLCVQEMEKIIERLKQLGENPDKSSPIRTFEEYLSEYRNTARGSEIASVQRQYALKLKEVYEMAKSAHESHVRCTDEMEKILEKLEKQIKEPHTNTKVRTVENLLKKYHKVATGSQVSTIQAKYKEKLTQMSDEASTARCEWAMKQIINELDSQIATPKADHKILSFEELLRKYRKLAGGSKLSIVEEEHKDELKKKLEKAFGNHNSLVWNSAAWYSGSAIAAGCAAVLLSPVAASALLAGSAAYVSRYTYTKLARKKE